MGAGCCALSDSDAADDTSPFDREDHNYSHQQSTLSQRRGVHIETAQVILQKLIIVNLEKFLFDFCLI